MADQSPAQYPSPMLSPAAGTERAATFLPVRFRIERNASKAPGNISGPTAIAVREPCGLGTNAGSMRVANFSRVSLWLGPKGIELMTISGPLARLVLPIRSGL